MSLTIGLTGGIASGKSLVGQYFSELNVPVIDADQTSRDVVMPGSAGLQKVVDHFGADILDTQGAMDRARMRQLVFNKPEARLELEAILHPLIREQLLSNRDEALEKSATPYCILMIPLLVKFGWTDLVDRLLVVDCSEESQIKRLIARDDIDEQLAHKMLHSQDSRKQRLEAADDVIRNESNAEALRKPVAELNARYTELARGEIPHLPPQYY